MHTYNNYDIKKKIWIVHARRKDDTLNLNYEKNL